MKNRFCWSASWLAVVFLACGGDLTEPGTDSPVVVVNQDAAPQAAVIARVVGHGELAAGGVVTIAAVLLSDGSTVAVWVMAQGEKGTVVGLVPPHASVDHYCVNTLITNIEGLEGFNRIVYVRDVGDGRTSFDELSFRGGFGLTCAAFPSPVEPFEALVKGDFKTSS